MRKGRWPFFNRKEMKPKHQNPNGTRSESIPPKEDEKLFDFDKSFKGKEESAETSEEGTEPRIAELETSLNELKEKNLRLLADFDNFKKRTTRERYELMSSASKDLIISLLPVLDDFERALKIENEAQAESFNEGIKLIYNRLLNILQSQGLKAMESNGETFDPDLHEAITEMNVQDPAQTGKVIDTIEKGYMLNDKIIRHAKVVVGK